jgi:hypothetical protein
MVKKIRRFNLDANTEDWHWHFSTFTNNFVACSGQEWFNFAETKHMAMNGYLFIAGVTQSQVLPPPGRGGQMVDTLQTWDGCASAIIYGGGPEQAQSRFEAWCQPPSVSREQCLSTHQKGIDHHQTHPLFAEFAASFTIGHQPV